MCPQSLVWIQDARLAFVEIGESEEFFLLMSLAFQLISAFWNYWVCSDYGLFLDADEVDVQFGRRTSREKLMLGSDLT